MTPRTLRFPRLQRLRARLRTAVSAATAAAALVAASPLFAGPAEDDALSKLLERYGRLPPAFFVEWRGDHLLVRQSPRPGPPWATVPFREHVAADFTTGRYAERLRRAGAGDDRDRGLFLGGGAAVAVDHLAHTRWPAGADGDEKLRALAARLPALLVRLLATGRERWSAPLPGAIVYEPVAGERWDIAVDEDTGRIQVLRIAPPGAEVLRHVYADEVDIGGAWIPRAITRWRGPDEDRRWRLERFGPLEGEGAGMEAPADYAELDALPADAFAWREEKLTDGAWRVGEGRARELFIAYAGFLVGFGPVDGDAARRIEAARRLSGGLPLRHVVVSHHHERHLAGLVEHVRRGARVIAHPDHEAPIFATLRAGGLDPENVEFQWVSDRYQLSDGVRRVIVRAVPTPHAEAMLLAFLPDERLVFAPDLWVAHRAAPEVATPSMITLNGWVQTLQPDTRVVVDTHSAILLDPVELAAAVARAADRGLGMERSLGPRVGLR